MAEEEEVVVVVLVPPREAALPVVAAGTPVALSTASVRVTDLTPGWPILLARLWRPSLITVHPLVKLRVG